jgi:hypothetical protein
MSTNRRDALKKGLAFVGASVGAGAASQIALAGTGSDVAAKKTAGATLVLHGRHWHITSQDIGRGELPPEGVRMLARGDLVDKAARGRKIGEFFATYYRLNAHSKVSPHEPGSLELHTFVFPDGTIVGSGTASAGADSQGDFAILGGTGRYLEARGSYVARQSYLDMGGDGSATFTLTLI